MHIFPLTILKFRDIIVPVSYTHLDVYKRQTKWCADPHGHTAAELWTGHFVNFTIHRVFYQRNMYSSIIDSGTSRHPSNRVNPATAPFL